MILLARMKKFSNLTILIRSPVSTSSAAAAAKALPPKNPFMLNYLITSCNLSPPEALKASQSLTLIRSPSQPDSVLRFLRQIGSTDDQIRSLISRHPRVLYANVDKTLMPRIKILQESGLSEPELVQLVSDNGILLSFRDLRPRIEFWKTLFTTNEDLLKAMRRGNLLASSVSKKIEPNILLLRGCGISDVMLARVILQGPYILSRSPESIKETIRRVDQLGVSRSSGMFVHLLRFMSKVSKATVDVKVKLLKSLGWSQEEVLAAFVKAPCLLVKSEKSIRSKMDFLVKEAGCERSYVASHPLFIAYSLDGRLIPRHRIVQILKSKELMKSGFGLYSVMPLSEERFLAKHVIPYLEKIPDLHETYDAACRGFSPSDLPHLLVSSPDLLKYSFRRSLLPKLQLWRGLLGSHDLLIKLLKKEQWVLTGSLDRTILPNLTFLRECEIPNERIAMVVKNHPRFILQKPSMLRAQAKLVEGLGVSHSWPMFLWALQAVRMVSAESFKAKMEIMRKFGWSELDFRFAFRRAPVFLSVSEKMMAKKMDFLLKEVGCEPSYLVLSPTLLMYSLEKRLIPRYRAMEVLKSRGLRGGNYKLHAIMNLPEKEFLEKFVLCHREAVPELYEMYLAGRRIND